MNAMRRPCRDARPGRFRIVEPANAPRLLVNSHLTTRGVARPRSICLHADSVFGAFREWIAREEIPQSEQDPSRAESLTLGFSGALRQPHQASGSGRCTSGPGMANGDRPEVFVSIPLPTHIHDGFRNGTSGSQPYAHQPNPLFPSVTARFFSHKTSLEVAKDYPGGRVGVRRGLVSFPAAYRPVRGSHEIRRSSKLVVAPTLKPACF